MPGSKGGLHCCKNGGSNVLSLTATAITILFLLTLTTKQQENLVGLVRNVGLTLISGIAGILGFASNMEKLKWVLDEPILRPLGNVILVTVGLATLYILTYVGLFITHLLGDILGFIADLFKKQERSQRTNAELREPSTPEMPQSRQKRKQKKLRPKLERYGHTETESKRRHTEFKALIQRYKDSPQAIYEHWNEEVKALMDSLYENGLILESAYEKMGPECVALSELKSQGVRWDELTSNRKGAFGTIISALDVAFRGEKVVSVTWGPGTDMITPDGLYELKTISKKLRATPWTEVQLRGLKNKASEKGVPAVFKIVGRWSESIDTILAEMGFKPRGTYYGEWIWYPSD